MTGSAINWGKSIGIWYGQWEDTPSLFEKMQWTNTPTKYLGVPLQHHQDTKDYWQGEVAEIKAKTARLGGRELSIFTKATMCNVF